MRVRTESRETLRQLQRLKAALGADDWLVDRKVAALGELRPGFVELIRGAGASVTAYGAPQLTPDQARDLLCVLHAEGRGFDPDPLLAALAEARSASTGIEYQPPAADTPQLAPGAGFDLSVVQGALPGEWARPLLESLRPGGLLVVMAPSSGEAAAAARRMKAHECPQARVLNTDPTLVLAEGTGPLPTEYPREDDAPQTLAHSRARYELLRKLVPGKRVLDIGCGAGLGTRILAEMGAAAVEGVERRLEALELARAAVYPDGVEVSFRQADLECGLPQQTASFDLVVVLEVLEHVAAQEQLLTEVRRVLRPGGVAVVSIPHAPFEAFWEALGGENPYHHHVPGIDQLRSQLRGFEAVHLFVQCDRVASLMIPLGSAARSPVPLRLSGSGELVDTGTISVLAVAGPRELDPDQLMPAEAQGYGDHQAALGSALAAQASLRAELQQARRRLFEHETRAKWARLSYPSQTGDPWATRLRRHLAWWGHDIRRRFEQ